MLSKNIHNTLVVNYKFVWLVPLRMKQPLLVTLNTDYSLDVVM